eukprot:CAMPEP_0203683208 /NCGR_PEP_ID=MMETSP0090-20130426/47400_1 /ASSEMBLY_ACC=CAM_ASM_001088 /TAXON_ID=426623 /ORGANISM="Chaetoceros affinis, Strain CCMP159" /LENGTH=721 /DNA_ID=CAMNT_0050552337 /DNA_START=1352 /DNA_END=3517 /DNA_ORIENTATION=-
MKLWICTTFATAVLTTIPGIASAIDSNSTASLIKRVSDSKGNHERTLQSSPCGCRSCTSSVLNRDADRHKVGARIDWLEANRGMSETRACKTVCGAEFPNVCRECDPDRCEGGPVPTPTPPSGGCCSWDGGRNCVMSETRACKTVCGAEFRDVCRECDPDRCEGGPVPTPTPPVPTPPSGGCCSWDGGRNCVMSETRACKTVCGAVFPNVCGRECDPDRCEGGPVPTPTPPSGGTKCNSISPNEYTLPGRFGRSNHCYRIQVRNGGRLLVDTKDPGCARFNAGNQFRGVSVSNYQRTAASGMAMYQGRWSGSIELLQDLSLSKATFEVSGNSRTKTFSGKLTVPSCGSGPGPTPPVPTPPVPTPPTSGSVCGCSSCTSSVLNRDADGHKVGARIDWLEANRGMSETRACKTVCGAEFPNVCGRECDPDRCEGGPVPTPTPPVPTPPSGGCCSWDGGRNCGETTDFCKSSQSNCENFCNGQWISGNGGGGGGGPGPRPSPTPPGPGGVASTTRYWDCSGGSCGCGYIPQGSSDPAHCPSNALFNAPSGNRYGAKFYGTAAISMSLGGRDWLKGCGQCFKVSGTGNVGGMSGKQTTLVLKSANFCPDGNPLCKAGPHFDIAAPGFDVRGASLSNNCEKLFGGTNAEKFFACEKWPGRGCDCDVFSDRTLREGCQNFLSLGWDNVQVRYERVSCPPELERQSCWVQNGEKWPPVETQPQWCANN